MPGPKIVLSESKGSPRAYVLLYRPLNSFEFEGVVGLTPLPRNNGSCVLVVSHLPIRVRDGKRIPSRIVPFRGQARGELAKRIAGLQVGTYVIVRGIFQMGWGRIPLIQDLEVVEDPGSRVQLDAEMLLDILAPAPKPQRPQRAIAPSRAKGRKLSAAQRQNMARRYAAGEAAADIADHYSTSYSTVRRAVQAAGLPLRPRGRHPGGASAILPLREHEADGRT